MTRYEQGFLTKCAEYGVDGRAMLKQAQWANIFRRIANKGFWRGSGAARSFRRLTRFMGDPSRSGKVGRYFELLGGGNKKTLSAYNKHKNYLYEQLANLGPGKSVTAQTLIDDLKALERAKSGGPMFHSVYGDIGLSTGKELAKVRAARVGTGMAAAGLAGTGLLAGSAVKNQSKPYTPMNPEPFMA